MRRSDNLATLICLEILGASIAQSPQGWPELQGDCFSLLFINITQNVVVLYDRPPTDSISETTRKIDKILYSFCASSVTISRH